MRQGLLTEGEAVVHDGAVFGLFVMDGLSLLTERKSFSRSGLGTISGQIYLRIGDAFFPEMGWSDLVVPITAAWLEAVLKLAQGTSWQEQVSFMDGPFWADLAMKAKGVVGINLVESRLKGDVIRYQLEIDPGLLLREAVSVASEVLAECQARGWADPDVAALARQRRQALRMLDGEPLFQ